MTSAGDHPVKAGDIVEGRYRIIGTLGEGGMGTVFLAEHVLIQRRLALKMLHARLATDIEVVERFMNEARAAGTLGHPNIVESTDMGFTRDNVPYIVFEYLQGSLLTDEIYRVGGLPVRRALRIAHQIASALDAAHNAGIVHRDLKSDNVFLTDREDVSDHAKVLDFGISRFIQLDSDLSRPGQVMGTPEYMAPEQVTSPEAVDARADIYALGVILYEMMAARCPFRADNDPLGVLHQVIHDPPPPLGLTGLPPGLQEMILTKLLAKDPAQRYQSMKDVAAAIEAFHLIIRPAGSRTPLSVTIPQTDEARAPTQRRPAVGASLAWVWLVAAVLAAGAGAGLMVIGDQTQVVQDTTTLPALEAAATRVAGMFDSAARAARLRAEGIATTPMLRAAIETDAATLKDMAAEGFLFTPKDGEVLEVFQLADGDPVSLLRMPEAAPAIAPLVGHATRFETDGSAVMVAASAPIERQDAGIGGAIAIALPIDLGPIKQSLIRQRIGATLVGLSQPIVLAPGAVERGTPTSIPVSVHRELSPAALTLRSSVPLPTRTQPRFQRARFVAWGVGGGLFILSLASLLRGRARRYTLER